MNDALIFASKVTDHTIIFRTLMILALVFFVLAFVTAAILVSKKTGYSHLGFLFLVPALFCFFVGNLYEAPAGQEASDIAKADGGNGHKFSLDKDDLKDALKEHGYSASATSEPEKTTFYSSGNVTMNDEFRTEFSVGRFNQNGHRVPYDKGLSPVCTINPVSVEKRGFSSKTLNFTMKCQSREASESAYASDEDSFMLGQDKK